MDESAELIGTALAGILGGLLLAGLIFFLWRRSTEQLKKEDGQHRILERRTQQGFDTRLNLANRIYKVISRGVSEIPYLRLEKLDWKNDHGWSMAVFSKRQGRPIEVTILTRMTYDNEGRQVLIKLTSEKDRLFFVDEADVIIALLRGKIKEITIG